MSRITRTAALALAASCVAATPATAAPTSDFVAGAELLRQPPGAGWDINLIIGAKFGTDDGSDITPVRRMQMSFPGGARFNGDKFKTCASKAKVEGNDCPSAAKIGSGTADIILGGQTPITVDVTVWNGPGTSSRRQVFLETKLVNVRVALAGTMRRTSGAYGYVLDLEVGTILPDLTSGRGVTIKAFQTSIGGSVRVKGKRIPLVSAPTKCKGGWKFSATFTYDASSSTVNSQMPCKLTATTI